LTKRKVFFISDRTGITAETLGGSLLTQFPKIQFTKTFIPFVTDVTSAKNAVSTIIEQTKVDGEDPIVFSTLTDPEILSIIATSSPNVFDLFGTFVGPLEKALESNSSRSAGKMHGISDTTAYETRLSALNFTLNHDDGLSPSDFHEADIVLMGVSRCGKTPTCLYLSMHYSLKAANYPLTSDDFTKLKMPEVLRSVKNKVYGLTIRPEQLSRIRRERRPEGEYSKLSNCRKEVSIAETLFKAENLPFLDTSTVSIEEIAATIVQAMGLH